MMELQELLREVEQRCVDRNHEVVLFLVKRLCNYQKARLRLFRFYDRIQVCVSFDPHIDDDDEEMWREHRRLLKKLTHKDPCYRCPACRNDPRFSTSV